MADTALKKKPVTKVKNDASSIKPDKATDTETKDPSAVGSLALWRIGSTGQLPGFTVRARTQSEALDKARVIDKRYHMVFFERLCNDSDMEDNVITNMSTDVFSKEVLTEFKKRSEVIKDSIGKIDASLEKIAFNLHWINAKQAYKADGFDTIVKYAQDTFGYQKTTCYSLISVVDRFAKRNEKGVMLEEFDDKVKGFSTSKLSLMANLSDTEIDALKPSMSVKEIRDYIKSLSAKPLPALPEGDSGTEESKPETSDTSGGDSADDVIDVESRDVARQVLISCKGREDYDAKVDKIGDFISRVLAKHPDALIEISYILPHAAGEKG